MPHQLSLLRALEIGPVGAAASSVLEVHSRGDPDLAMEKEWTIDPAPVSLKLVMF